MKNNLILNQGYKAILIALILSILVGLIISDTLGDIGLLITLFLVFIYRNPYRHVYENTTSVLSPVDGTVTAIDNVDGKQKIYIKVNLCNTHVVRAPITGEFKIKNKQNGLNLNPNSYKASLLNAQTTLKFKNEQLSIKFLSGMCNSKIDLKNGSNVSQGEELGLFLDGNVIISTKHDNDLSIKIGDKLKSAQTILFKKV